MGSYTGTVPTFLAGELPDADKFTELSNLGLALTGAWTTWTPTLTNLTKGNGTVVARYRQIGKTLDYFFRFTLGSTSAVGTSPQFTFPATLSSSYGGSGDLMGQVLLTDTGTANRFGSVLYGSSTTGLIYSYSTTGILTTITATVPHTWANTDVISVSGTVELA